MSFQIFFISAEWRQVRTCHNNEQKVYIYNPFPGNGTEKPGKTIIYELNISVLFNRSAIQNNENSRTQNLQEKSKCMQNLQ